MNIYQMRLLNREFSSLALLRSIGSLALLGALVGCSNLPNAPAAVAFYDLGNTALSVRDEKSNTAKQVSRRMPLILDTVTALGIGEGAQAVQYRELFAQENRLRAYQQARWSQPPARLFEQQLRTQLQQHRPVLDGGFNLTRVRDGDQYPAVLKVDVISFEQTFHSAQQSSGDVQVRVTLLQPQSTGDVLLGQKIFAAQTPSDRADASAGTSAIAESAQKVIAAIDQWVIQLER